MYTTSLEKTIWKVLWIIIIAVILYGMFGDILKGFALGNSRFFHRYNGCIRYTYAMVTVSYAPMLQHSDCSGTPSNNDRTHKTVVTVVTVDVPSTPSTPNVPDNNQPAPKHCNNGEGQGGEGCSPAQSQHANNDENHTTPSEDHNPNK